VEAGNRAWHLGNPQFGSRVKTRGVEVLLGRRHEIEVLKRVLDNARQSQGDAVVVLGEPGIGKTALIDEVVGSVHDVRVLRSVGNEAEMELPYAALQRLFAPVLGRMTVLPEPQRNALQVAFGLVGGDPPERLVVALAALTLVSELAEERPVVCVLDDAQWLDRASAQALAFGALRASTVPAAFVFGARVFTDELRGLPELPIEGLRESDARTLMVSALPQRLDESVVEQMVAETHGNPLALLELPRGRTPAQLAGGFGVPLSIPLSGRIEESFRRRFRKLPAPARQLILVAAADPTGDPALVWRAAELLGIPDSAADAIDAVGLLDIHPGVVFRHPLVRSAVYRAALPQDRRRTHQALADATDPEVDPDRRAWHRAQSIARTDESVAEELERSASRAQARGGFAAAAAFLERAAELTADPAQKARRSLNAAEAKREAGSFEATLRLAAVAQQGPLDETEHARLDVLRAQISFASQRGDEAPPLLLQAASRLEPINPRAARETYLDALTAALFAGRLAKGANAVDIAHAALTAPGPEGQPRASDLLLDGLALLITAGATTGTPVLQRALAAFRSDVVSDDERLRWSWLAGRAAGFIWDYENWDLLTARQVDVARDTGALTVLPLTLSTRAGVQLFAGEISVAASLVEQVQSIADVIDSRTVPYAALAVAGFRGNEADALPLIKATREDFIARGEGMGVTLTQWATAVLYNGLARYDLAFVAAEQALEDPGELWFSPWAAVELIEAASRTERSERAASALKRLVQGTTSSGTEWALAIEARCRALLSEGCAAESGYQEAIDRLVVTTLRWDLARSRLVYGEWLRRERRTKEAREQLRLADELFSEFGAQGFTERARVELRAAGEQVRERSPATRYDLTPQEAQISRLVAQGSTNREIASELFISPSTVEYHLHKVFSKLGVRSRAQLANWVHQSGDSLSPRRKD
jgi:DNA-binding CsgD family transcriptional regulator